MTAAHLRAAAFRVWFEKYRTADWERRAKFGAPMPVAWLSGIEALLREGFEAGILWCNLCQKEHEGPCIANETPGGSNAD